MPPTMQPMMKSRTKRARGTKNFECVHVGPIRLYFSCWQLIGIESDKTKIVVLGGATLTTPGDGYRHRRALEPDESKWLSPTEFSEKWATVSEIYLK